MLEPRAKGLGLSSCVRVRWRHVQLRVAGEVYFELNALCWVGRTMRRLPKPTAQESYDFSNLKLWEGATPPPHSNARARLPGAPHARAMSAMAGISPSYSGADAAPLSPPPEPLAGEGHGGSLHPPGSAAPAAAAPAPAAPALTDAALSAVAAADRSPLGLTPAERYLLRDIMRPSDRLAGLLGVSVVGGAG